MAQSPALKQVDRHIMEVASKNGFLTVKGLGDPFEPVFYGCHFWKVTTGLIE